MLPSWRRQRWWWLHIYSNERTRRIARFICPADSRKFPCIPRCWRRRWGVDNSYSRDSAPITCRPDCSPVHSFQLWRRRTHARIPRGRVASLHGSQHCTWSRLSLQSGWPHCVSAAALLWWRCTRTTGIVARGRKKKIAMLLSVGRWWWWDWTSRAPRAKR